LHQLASRVKGMDMIISIDSMPVHLAGALGVPVWTLLHADADWRWMRNRDDSPWYPTMKLFRQKKQDEWHPVIESVVRDLQHWQRTSIVGELTTNK
jgi:ADP-heptose:LPS heptosyltransferase